VSPSYAREIQSGPEYGQGMENELLLRRADLFGVLNGIDPEEWNPVTDPLIPERYSSQLLQGKDACKAELQRGAGLPADQKIPVIGMVTRLVEQKGIDLLLEALPELVALEAQWILLGEGDRRYHEALAAAARMHPGRLSVSLKFDSALAHRVQAGSDMFLMPSRYEPCGLTQMYALRYGAVPVVRHTGGLADTVRDAHQDPAGNGFKFHTYSARELVETVRRALWTFRQSGLWRQIMRRGMAEDFSWERSAGRYLELYARPRTMP
jgi:starch synthase